MKLLVILILVGHEVSGNLAASLKAETTKTERITPFNKNANVIPEKKQAIIDKHHVNHPNDGFVRARHHHVASEEFYEKPKRERETDEYFLKNVLKEILAYNKFKHLILRDSNGRKRLMHFGIKIGYDENESAAVADAKVPVDSVSKELRYGGVRVPGISKRIPKQAEPEKDTNFHYFKDRTDGSDAIKLSKNLKKDDKSYKKVEEGLRNMAMAIENYLQHSKTDENEKSLGVSQGGSADMPKENVVIDAEESKNLVNHMISEIKRLLTTHKSKSKLFISRILDIFTKKQELLISHPNQACRESKMNYLIHGINTVYQRYLTNAECEGEYVDTGLDVFAWISSNKKYIKADREMDSNKVEINSSGDDQLYYTSKEDRLQRSYSSGEVRLSNSLENKQNRKAKDAKRSLTRDDSLILTSKELESDEDNQDPNKELLDIYIKSRLIKALRSIVYHRSDPYYREIEKLFTKQEHSNTALDSIRLVCEKIASEQLLRSVEAIIWRLLQNRDCKPEIALKDVNHIKKIKPVAIDITKHPIAQKALHPYSFEESSEDDTPDFNDSSNLSYEDSVKLNTDSDKNGQNDEDSYSDYDAVPLKFKQFVMPISEINLRSKHKRFRDITRLQNNKIDNILGSGKINSLKVIKQKLKDFNIKDYKKLMENLPMVEKLLKIIYNRLPPHLQTILKVLKPAALKMIENGGFSVKNIPSLLSQAFSKGEGKDLFKMMADKLKRGKFKKAGKLSEKFQDKTRLRDIVPKVSEPADNKINDSNSLVHKHKIQAKPEASQLDTLPRIELPSSIEKKDQSVVELTYIFNNPPIVYYKPKFFVKHNISYDQYLKNIKSIYNNDLLSTGNQIQLVKVTKREGNNSQVFYETDVPNAAVEVSNKSAILKLYDQFYNSTENINKNASSVEKKYENYDNNKRQKAEVLKSVPPTAKDKFNPTNSTVFPMVGSRETTEFKTAKSIFKNNDFALNLDDSKSEDDAKSADVDNNNMEKPKPQDSSEVYFSREGKIRWNGYPINRPKHINRKLQNREKKNERPKH